VRRESIVVRNPVGLHARPAAAVVRIVRERTLMVTLEANGKAADGRSILSVLGLGVRQGDEVVVSVDGGGGTEEADLMEAVRNVLEGANGTKGDE